MRTTLNPFGGTKLVTPFPTDWSELLRYCGEIDTRMDADKKYTLKQGQYEDLLKHIKTQLPNNINLANGMQELKKCQDENIGLAIREALVEEFYKFLVNKIRNEIHAHLKLKERKDASETFDVSEDELTAKRTPDIAAKALWNILNQFETMRKSPVKILPGIVLSAIQKKPSPLYYLFNYFQNDAEPIINVNFVTSFTQLLKLLATYPSEMVAHVSTLNPLSMPIVINNFGTLKDKGVVSSTEPAQVIKEELTAFLFEHYQIQTLYGNLKRMIRSQIRAFATMTATKETTARTLQDYKLSLLTDLTPLFDGFNARITKFKSLSPSLADITVDYWSLEDKFDEQTQLLKSDWVKVYNPVSALSAEIKASYEHLFTQLDAAICEKTTAELAADEAEKKREREQQQVEAAERSLAELDAFRVGLETAKRQAEAAAAELEAKRQAEKAAAETESKRLLEEAEQVKAEAVTAIESALKAAEEIATVAAPKTSEVEEKVEPVNEAPSASEDAATSPLQEIKFVALPVEEDSLSPELERAIALTANFRGYTAPRTQNIFTEIEQTMQNDAEEKATKAAEEEAKKIESTGPFAADHNHAHYQKLNLRPVEVNSASPASKTITDTEEEKSSQEDKPVENIPYDAKATETTRKFVAATSAISDKPLPVISATPSFSFKKKPKPIELEKLSKDIAKHHLNTKKLIAHGANPDSLVACQFEQKKLSKALRILKQGHPHIEIEAEQNLLKSALENCQRFIREFSVHQQLEAVAKINIAGTALPAPSRKIALPEAEALPLQLEEIAQPEREPTLWQKHGGWIVGVLTGVAVFAAAAGIVAVAVIFWEVTALLAIAALIKIAAAAVIGATVSGSITGVVTQDYLDKQFQKEIDTAPLIARAPGVNTRGMTRSMGGKQVSAPYIDSDESSLSASTSSQSGSEPRVPIAPIPGMGM